MMKRSEHDAAAAAEQYDVSLPAMPDRVSKPGVAAPLLAYSISIALSSATMVTRVLGGE
jgi:hypothetical protein